MKDKSVQTWSDTGSYTYPSFGLILGGQTQLRTRTVETNKWFSASFKYWIPPVSTSKSPSEEHQARQQLTRISYGLDLSPSLIWELMPWSWLVDWGTNIGANLSNLSDNQDNLVAMYAYLMQSDVITDHYQVTGRYLQSPTTRAFSAESLLIHEIKQRNQASPFGFGITVPQFNLRQLAILAALGLSRIR